MKKTLTLLALLLALLGNLLCPLAAGEGEESDPLLTLANPWNPVPADWKSDLTPIGSGHRVDSRCADDLLAMLSDCRAAGLSPIVRSSYRSQQTQSTLYANKVRQMEQAGYQGQAARDAAARVVARPGTSEHQLGLAVDLVDKNYQVLNEKQENTAAQKWLMEHSWEYGFILRYPTGKSEITGIIYEPWHYRYVGRENAKAIQESGLCLEEYLEEQARQREEQALAEQQRQKLYQAALETLNQQTENAARQIYQLLTGGQTLPQLPGAEPPESEPAQPPAAGQAAPESGDPS